MSRRHPNADRSARCPLCSGIKPTFMHNGQRIYVHHNATDGTRNPDVCAASGWLVEDDELLDRTPPPPPHRTKRETT